MLSYAKLKIIENDFIIEIHWKEKKDCHWLGIDVSITNRIGGGLFNLKSLYHRNAFENYNKYRLSLSLGGSFQNF